MNRMTLSLRKIRIKSASFVYLGKYAGFCREIAVWIHPYKRDSFLVLKQAGQSCRKSEFLKMRRKTGIYKNAVTQLTVHPRKDSEWTFHQIGRYLHYDVKRFQKVYYSQKKKSK